MSFPIILLLAAALSFLLGWTMRGNGSDNEKWIPDIINIYSNEKKTVLTARITPDLFNKVTSLVVFDRRKMMSGGNPPVLADDIKEMKKSAVEYVYDKPISIQINNDGEGNVETIHFDEILFPIYDNGEGPCYIKTTDDVYLFYRNRDNLQWIVKHL